MAACGQVMEGQALRWALWLVSRRWPEVAHLSSRLTNRLDLSASIPSPTFVPTLRDVDMIK